MINNQAAPVICILGMHRSGTSCLTGSLQQAGLPLGKYHSWNRYNQKGNRENQDVVDFHEALLQANKARWDKPPRKMRFTEQDVQRARELVNDYLVVGSWGFKDPRTLLALDLWRQATERLMYIGIFRHPMAVARSLSQRSSGAISEEQGVQLWLHYNRLLYKNWQNHPFPMLCFDWDEAEFHRRLDVVLPQLGLKPLAESRRFYSQELMHFETHQWQGMPWRVRRLYSKLRRACDVSALASAGQ